jgi:diguanylate cyclase (GGDEF)-like protein
MSTETENKTLDSRLYSDELTKIFNRRYLKEKIPGHLAKAEEEGFNVCLFMIDMDKFKAINDTHGHGVGDRALKHFSDIISKKSKDKGFAIRYAGDEFVLVLSKLDKKEARDLGREIQQILTETPLQVKDVQITLGCSIGVSMFPKDGKTLKMLFEKADEALYMAKDRGRGTVVVFPDSGKLLVPSKLNSVLETPEVVGRDDVIQFMDEHLSKKGNPQVFPVLLGGDGTGKSRLMEYARGRAQKKLAFTLFAKGYPLWQTEMYGAIFSALGRLFEQKKSISDKIFSGLENKYKVALKSYFYTWDTKEVDPTADVSESEGATLFEALTQTFSILREMGDGALLLDDADQIDEPSLQFFDSQFVQEEGGKLFFMSSVNSADLLAGEEKLMILFDSIPEMATGSEIKKIHLEPLQLEHIRQLTEKLFDGKTLPAESEKSLLDKSNGNPLFIIEALSFLLLKGKIEVVGDEWDLSLTKPDDIPSSLSDMIKDRLMSMNKEAIDVLKLASILGEKINSRQLAEMSKLNWQQILDILINARRALLIQETPNPEEFVFSHRLDRSVFYSLMTEEERRHYHSLAADIEQKFMPGSLDRVVGKLAYHFQSAGQMEQASKMFSNLKSQMRAVSISKGARKLLQKRISTSSLAKESTLDDEDLALAVDLGRAFRATLNNIRLYPKEHENVKTSVERFLELLDPFLKEKTEVLSISSTPQAILFNGQPPPPTRDDPRLTADLHEILGNYGLQGVLFLSGITQDEILRFLDAFTKHPEEVAGQWDVLVNELDLSHILPDRKMFVAVGEHKVILDKTELLAQSPESAKDGPQGLSVSEVEAPEMSSEQIKQLKTILDQFAKEKKELLDAMKLKHAGEIEFQQLVNLLQHTDIAKAEEAVRESGEMSPAAEEAPPPKDTYDEVLPDRDIVDLAEQDLSRIFNDLNSEDTETRAKAAAWLTKQEPARVAEAGLKAVASDIPLKARRLVASVIQKAGEAAVDAFLEQINPNAPGFPLLKLITIADTFIGNPKLLPILRGIALTGPTETVRPTIEVLDQIPGKEVNTIFLEVFNLAAGKVKMDILTLFAKRRVIEAVPQLLEIITPKKTWESEGRISLQEKICKTLGEISSPESADTLIAVATVPKPWTLLKAKPDSVREAATLALRQLPDKVKIRKALDVLKSDKSPQVRKAARQ